MTHKAGCGRDSQVMIPPRFAAEEMKRFVEGADRGQSTLFPECLEDWICEDNPVRAIDVLSTRLSFGGVEPEATGQPSYHPSSLLKLYIYGHLNRIQSSRRLEVTATQSNAGRRSASGQCSADGAETGTQPQAGGAT